MLHPRVNFRMSDRVLDFLVDLKLEDEDDFLDCCLDSEAILT